MEERDEEIKKWGESMKKKKNRKNLRWLRKI